MKRAGSALVLRAAKSRTRGKGAAKGRALRAAVFLSELKLRPPENPRQRMLTAIAVTGARGAGGVDLSVGGGLVSATEGNNEIED
jgi:hypothetical protein